MRKKKKMKKLGKIMGLVKYKHNYGKNIQNHICLVIQIMISKLKRISYYTHMNAMSLIYNF